MLFRELSEAEEKEFRGWARKFYVPLEPIKGIWHPVVQDECTKINSEVGSRVTEEAIESVIRKILDD